MIFGDMRAHHRSLSHNMWIHCKATTHFSTHFTERGNSSEKTSNTHIEITDKQCRQQKKNNICQVISNHALWGKQPWDCVSDTCPIDGTIHRMSAQAFHSHSSFHLLWPSQIPSIWLHKCHGLMRAGLALHIMMHTTLFASGIWKERLDEKCQTAKNWESPCCTCVWAWNLDGLLIQKERNICTQT